MPPENLATNADCLAAEIAWLQRILDLRFAMLSGERPSCDVLREIPAPKLDGESPYAAALAHIVLTDAERLILILALMPHLRPETLDPFFTQNQALLRPFTEFGGVSTGTHGSFLPTTQTAVMLLAGDNLTARLNVLSLFEPGSPLLRNGLITLHRAHHDEPLLSAALQVPGEGHTLLLTGGTAHAVLRPEFPAQLITTAYEWDDLVLADATRRDIEDIVDWVRYERQLMDGWGLEKRLKRGYRSLFCGPPGTGKSLTACLLGKATAMPVYRVDLSRVVSKYIGETEKNLASLFDHAEHRRWILFFDEADSLFGKRTESRTSNDRSANQQISYLLQRIEDFDGVVILATNQRSFMDEAFSRRFQSIIQFAIPDAEQRLRLWEDNFADKPYTLAPDINLARLARDYEVSGGSIINVLRYACLRAVARDPQQITAWDLETAIRNECRKSGRFA